MNYGELFLLVWVIFLLGLAAVLIWRARHPQNKETPELRKISSTGDYYRLRAQAAQDFSAVSKGS